MKLLTQERSQTLSKNKMLIDVIVQLPVEINTTETIVKQLRLLINELTSDTYCKLMPDQEKSRTFENVITNNLFNTDTYKHAITYTSTATIVNILFAFDQNPTEGLDKLNKSLIKFVKEGKAQKFYQKNLNENLIKIEFYADDEMYVTQTINIVKAGIDEKKLLEMLNLEHAKTSLNYKVDKNIVDNEGNVIGNIIEQSIFPNQLKNFSSTI